jgi:hypothetical protein
MECNEGRETMTTAKSNLTLREIFEHYPDRVFMWRTRRPGKLASRATYFANMRPRRECTQESFAEYRRAEDAWRVVWHAKRLPRWLEKALMAKRTGCPAVDLAELHHQKPPPAIEVARWKADREIAAADDDLQHALANCARHISNERRVHARCVAKARAVVARIERREQRLAA